jgi:hypothetical protein
VCFEAGLATAQHKVDHAMQCLLTRKEVGKQLHVKDWLFIGFSFSFIQTGCVCLNMIVALSEMHRNSYFHFFYHLLLANVT